MKAIILAAGMGNRLLHLTSNTPKCKIKVYGKPIIEHQLDVLRSLGITDISIVKGFLSEQIDYPGTKSYYNEDYRHNGTLSSFFYADNELNDDVIVTYGDIIFEKDIIEELIYDKSHISMLVGEDWEKAYLIRKDSPLEEVEKVIFDNGKVKKIGKHLASEEANGEFTGIAKFTKKGTAILKEVYYDALNRNTNAPFQNASSIKTAHLTDIFQELIYRGYDVTAVHVKGGWIEIDTLGDLKRAGGEISAPKITPEARRVLLKDALAKKGFVRIIEAHSGISAIIANNAIAGPDKKSFDGIWISSLTESASKGQHDIEVMGVDSRLATASQILEVSNKPVIMDGDTGGDPNAFEYIVRRAESLGISAVIVEDKVYPKRNSLDDESNQILENPHVFAKKIKRGKNALLTEDTMVIARIESLIAGTGLEDALERAKLYLQAGADGIMIHSKSKSPDEIISFARKYKELISELGINKPLVCVPTTYNSIRESELQREGFNIVIHANHLLRASIKSMQKVCEIILQNERSLEADQHCSNVNEIFDIVGFSDIKNKEKMWRNQ